MKIKNSGYIAKGVALAASGIVIAFMPGIISWLFYIIGIIIIASCVLMLFTSLSGGDFMLPTSIFGILLGAGFMVLPRFLSVTIPLVAGIIFGIMGISRLINASKQEKARDSRIGNGIVGVILLAAAIFLIFDPFKATALARIIIGVMLFLGAAFNFYVAYTIKKRNDGSSSGIIDI